MRYALLTAMTAALAGCTTVEDPFLTGSVSGAAVHAPALTREIAPSQALAGLTPALGAPRAVRQTAPAGENSLRQVIVYANTTGLAGENMLVVEGGQGADGRYRRPPGRNALLAEMNAAMPGVPMQISSVIGENAYGVYGYATGPYRGGSCLYGWQATAGGGIAGSAYPAQIRLRFCHERISQERIPLLMRSLTLRPLTAQTLAMLRAAPAAATPVEPAAYGEAALFDVPAERAPRPAPVPVTDAPAAPAAPRLTAKAPPPAQILPAAEKPVPVIAHAARVPLPGQAAVAPAETPAAPAESEAGLKQKAANAWAAARARLSGAEPAS